MDLRNSSNLKELADLSTATNLQELNLSYCSKLEKLPDLSTATNLQELDLSHCYSLVELSLSIGNAINLQKMDLSHCYSLVELSLSIGNAINLQKLDLGHCSRLVELSSSIGSAVNLQEMNIEYCSSLVRLPFSFENAINLERMNLKYCSSLVELPFSIGYAIKLQTLYLNHCSILMELPSSMRNLRRLRFLKLERCLNLRRLRFLKLERCSELEVNLANINLESLEELDLSDCSWLKSYRENSTDIQELDPWIRRISHLQKLVLNGMEKLTSLPQLPDSVVELDAENCESLERLYCSFGNPGIRLNFKNCFKLNQEARDLIIHTPTIQFAVFPTVEVPRCFTCRSFGSSLTVKLNEMPLGESIKFKDCVIYADDHELRSVSGGGLICSYVSSGRHSIISSEKTDQFLPWHLHTFVVEVKTEELTSTELAFYFEISYSGYYGDEYYMEDGIYKPWEIIECGIM